MKNTNASSLFPSQRACHFYYWKLLMWITQKGFSTFPVLQNSKSHCHITLLHDLVMKHHNALVHGNRIKDMESTLALNYLALDGLNLNLLDAFMSCINAKSSIQDWQSALAAGIWLHLLWKQVKKWASIHGNIGQLSKTPLLILTVWFYP